MQNKTCGNAAKPKVILHGECMVIETRIPEDAVEFEVEGPYLVVADSETTGNHHVVDRKKGVKFFRVGERRFMRNTVATKIRCVHKDRHDDVTIAPGEHEFGTQQEFDPFAERLRKVRD